MQRNTHMGLVVFIKNKMSKMQEYGAKKSGLMLLRRLLLVLSEARLKYHVPYLLSRFLHGHAIRDVNGFQMYLDLKNDVGISKDLFIFGKREHLSTDYIQTESVLRVGQTVLDIGANIGYYALIESRLVGPTGTVYAIEPVSNNYRLLKKNIELNGITNIHTFQLAVGKEKGTAEIFVGEKGNISSLLHKSGARFVKKEPVTLVTVDQFTAEHGFIPDLIRMDVEGYETEIIKGMPETLSRRPTLLIEVHPHLIDRANLREMFCTLENTGYRSAIIIYDPKQQWLRTDGTMWPLLRHLSGRIERNGYTFGMDKIERLSFAELIKSLSRRDRSFHALLT